MLIVIFIILCLILIFYLFGVINGVFISIIITLIGIIHFLLAPPKDWNDVTIYRKITLDNIISDIKPGDLVLFSSNKFQTITRTIGDRTFSHIGIVIMHNNELSILEITWNGHVLIHQKHSKGLQINKLSDRIYSYAGNVYIASLNKNIPEFTNIVNQILSENYKFTESWKLPFVIISNINLDHQRFCSEYIADILNRTNISSVPWNSKKIDLQSAIVKLCNGDVYSDPVQIIDNRLLINNIRDNKAIRFS